LRHVDGALERRKTRLQRGHFGLRFIDLALAAQALGLEPLEPVLLALGFGAAHDDLGEVGAPRFEAGQAIKGARIDVAFVGSCTNGRLSDLRVAAEVAKKGKVAPHVRALIVPGSQQVARAAEAEGLHEIFQQAGFQWRKAGCSMCLGMNDDKLQGREMSASSSNRNFIGRQGSPTGRTLLMSPAMVAAAAITGAVADVREILK